MYSLRNESVDTSNITPQMSALASLVSSSLNLSSGIYSAALPTGGGYAPAQGGSLVPNSVVTPPDLSANTLSYAELERITNSNRPGQLGQFYPAFDAAIKKYAEMSRVTPYLPGRAAVAEPLKFTLQQLQSLTNSTGALQGAKTSFPTWNMLLLRYDAAVRPGPMPISIPQPATPETPIFTPPIQPRPPGPSLEPQIPQPIPPLVPVFRPSEEELQRPPPPIPVFRPETGEVIYPAKPAEYLPYFLVGGLVLYFIFKPKSE